MALGERINRFFMNFEWRLSLILAVGGGMTSFALPAWAVKAANIFAEYSPASWVGAGFAGFILFALCFALIGWGRGKWVRARYDAKMISGGSFVDPMAKTYEDKRIFLSEFCMPSLPLIEGKTFINCEIIGPANIMLEYGNNVQEARYPISDAVLLKPDHHLFNAIVVRNCIFRQCAFSRITFMVPANEYETAKNWQGFNWVTRDAPPPLPPTRESDLNLLPPDTGEGTPRPYVSKAPSRSGDLT